MADKKLKRKYQQAPKEKKYSFIAFPFAIIMVILAILSAVGLGLIPLLIGIVICLCGVLIPLVFAKKEHKKWVEEGNKEYRYYDPDTGEEVDENGNPLTDEPAPIQEPKQEEPNLPEPDENGDIEEPAPVEEKKPQPQAEQAPKKQPAKYEPPFFDFVRSVFPPVGFGLFALVFLLRTIISIRELVYYGQNGGVQYYHIPHLVRLFGTLALLIITVISLVNRYTKKQTANQYYSSLLKIAIWFAIIGFYGFAYHAAHITIVTINCIKYGFDFFDTMFDNILEAFVFVIFGIAIIVFVKMALANKIDCKTRKILAAVPFGIMIIYSIVFMIMTGIHFAPGYAAGYYVTAVILIVACGAIGCIPFFCKFEDKPLDEAAASKAAAAAVAPAAAPVYQEPASEPKPQPQQPQPQKKNNDNGDPEVKSNKKGLLIILIVVAALVLCGGGGVGVYFLIKNAQNQKNNNEEWGDDSSYYSSKSSSSSSKSSSKSSSSSAKSYTASAVIAEIDRLNTGSATHYYLEGDIYYLLISYGSTYAVEANLKAAVTNLTMPSYLTARSDAYSGTWNDGAKGYFQYFDTPKKDVTVYVGSYILTTDEGDDLVAQIAVYNN